MLTSLTTSLRPAPPTVQPASLRPEPLPEATAAREQERRLLFVGVDAGWFVEVEHELRELRPVWSFLSASDLAQAEAMFTAVAFDAVVVDSKSPAAALFSGPEKKAGAAVCLVRCDMSDRADVALWNRRGATPISVDSGASTLVTSLARAWRLREWMAVPAIRRVLLQIRKLPVQPQLYEQVSAEMQSPHGSMQVVAGLIAKDPVMSAKILQMVNSAFFGLANEITDIAEAVMLLGTERLRALVLLAGVFSEYKSTTCAGFSAEPIWQHSMQVASMSRAIAMGETGNVSMADAAFTAGLLHDIGKLFLAGNLPELYSAVIRMQQTDNLSARGAELTVLGATHAELGGCLLATWGLPLPILEAIAWHHEPERSAGKGFSLLAAVHVANVFAQEASPAGATGVRDRIELQYLTLAGLGDCRDRWREYCGLQPKPDSEEKPKT